MAKDFLRVSVLSHYFFSHLQGNVEKAGLPEGPESIQYLQGLLTVSEAKEQSKTEALALLQCSLHQGIRA